MFAFRYKQRLEKDIDRWIERGWIGKSNGQLILQDSAKSADDNRIFTIIGMLGMALLLAGVLTFVAANWQDMSKLARLAILFSAMWAVFAAAVWVEKTVNSYLQEGLLFLGAGIFGAFHHFKIGVNKNGSTDAGFFELPDYFL